jgi:alpha-L-arabinofuranosidase
MHLKQTVPSAKRVVPCLVLGALIWTMALSPEVLHATGTPVLSVSFDNLAGPEGGNSKGTCYSLVEGKGRNGDKCLMYQKQTSKPTVEGKRDNFHYDIVARVQPHQTYIATAWFKAEGDLRPSLRVATEDWQTLAAGICADTRQWQEVRVPFHSADNQKVRLQLFGGGKTEERESAVGTSYCDQVALYPADAKDLQAMRQCRVTVNAKAVLHEIKPLFFGVNTLFWIEDDASLKDGRLATHLREMPCRLMRFPGGEVGDNYHWKTRKLDDLKQFPSSEGPDKLDCDKFMVLCRQVGAAPIFVVNLESGFVHGDVDAAVKEASDWVRYANREKGYHVKYWEIGNETYLPGTYYPTTACEYADAFLKFSRAMKAVDPSIQIGAVGPLEVDAVVPLDRLSIEELARQRALKRSARKVEVKKEVAKKTVASGDPWWPTLVKRCGPAIDFVIVHRYYPQSFGPDANADKPIVSLKQYLAAQFPGRYLPVALTEWNAGKNTPAGLASALIVAELIGDYVKAGVDMACLWPIRYPGSVSKRTLFDLESNAPKASYTVMNLYSSNMGPGTTLIQSVASNKQVYTCASLSSDGKRVAVFLLNKAPAREGAEAIVALSGLDSKSARAVTLASPDLKLDKAALQETPVTASGSELSLHLPPNSLTVVTCQ